MCLFSSVTSLSLNPQTSLKDGTSEATATDMSMQNYYGLPEEIPSMPGFETKLLAMDLNEMGMELSSDFMAALDQKVQHKRAKPMMWVHIHKAAGTYMCAAAKANGESLVTAMHNCNYGPDGGQGALYVDSWSCKDRTKHFSKGNFTYGQIERVLNSEMCFDTFDYGIWLRDPVKLALTEANYKYSASNVESNLKCAGGGKCPKNYKTDHKDEVPLWMYFDNYVVRVLGGPRTWRKGPGKVTEEDAKNAINLLRKFAVKARAEDIAANKESKERFLEEMGWTQMPATFSDKRAKKHRFTFSTQEEEKIRELNKYDYMLYDYVGKHN